MPDTQPVVRAYLARVDDVNRKDRSLIARLSTASLDRYKTVIEPKGMDLSRYNQNKVVLYEHGLDPMRGTLPVGRNGWLKPAIGPQGPELIGKTFFYDKESKKGDDFTERLFECYHSGDMRGFSVRVMPTVNCSPPTTDEIRARPELADCYMMYRGTELCEYSAVAVPGNADCLTLDEARSILAVVKRGLQLPPELVKRAEAAMKPIRHALMKDAAGWHVIDENGGVVSSHETREEAMLQMDQLAAEHTKVADHGGGGDDDTTSSVAMSLPPLAGRSIADYRSDLLGQVRGLFNPEIIRQVIKDRRDQAAGKV